MPETPAALAPEHPTARAGRGAVLPVRLVPPDFRSMPVPVRGGTRLATASLVLGIVSSLLNPLILPSLVAIVFGSVSLARRTRARGRAIAGIVLGLLGVVFFFVQLALLVPVFLGLQAEARANAIESELVNAASERGDTLAELTCPALPEFVVGGTVYCAGEYAGAVPVRIGVTFTDPAGSFTAREVPAA